jgi:endo-1,4-beta-xylanase
MAIVTLFFFTSFVTSHAAPALKDAFKDCFRIGAALNQATFMGQDTNGVAIVKAQFNTITPENILKWESVHPEPGKFAFDLPDQYVAFGEKNGMFIIGHTLVWHSQTPRWVFQDDKGNRLERDALLDRLKEHISTVVGRYKGRVRGWDVVNEALNDDGSMRNTMWYRIIGDDFLIKAFQFAHEADPGAELYYNEFSLEKPGKRKGAIALIKKLQAAGVPVTGIGYQAHVKLASPSAEDIDTTISELAGLGIKVMITELDVDALPSASGYTGADVSQREAYRAGLNPYTNGLPAEVQQKLADRYRDLFRVFVKHRDAISRVTFWGVEDGGSWLNSFPVRGRTNYPLLFDRQYRAKPAFEAVISTAPKVGSK